MRLVVRERRSDAVWLAVGVLVLMVGMLVVSDGTVRPWERRVFRAVNDLPDFLYPVLWPLQQLGAILVVPTVAFVLLLLGRRWLALAVVSVGVAKLILEHFVKALVSRQRPGTSIGDDIHTRGGVNLRGESFVSGHAVLAASLAGVIAPHLPRQWRAATWMVVIAVMLARVYVGAHNPLDVVCGAALGVAAAGAVDIAIGARRLEAR